MTYNSSKKSKARCYLSEIYQGRKGIMHQERFSPRILHTRGLLNGLLTAVQHKDTKSQSTVSLNPCCITVSPVQLPSAKLADMQFPRLDLHMKQEYILEFIYKSTLFSHRHIKKLTHNSLHHTANLSSFTHLGTKMATATKKAFPTFTQPEACSLYLLLRI